MQIMIKAQSYANHTAWWKVANFRPICSPLRQTWLPDAFSDYVPLPKQRALDPSDWLYEDSYAADVKSQQAVRFPSCLKDPFALLT